MMTEEEANNLTNAFQAQVTAPVLAFARLEDEKIFDPQVSVPLSAPGPNDARTYAHAQMPVMPARKVAPQLVAPSPFAIVPDLPQIADLPPPLPKIVSPPVPDPVAPDLEGPSFLSLAERAAVTTRASQNLSPEMLKNFDLFLYVSKAARGPLAQRLYVFKKHLGGGLSMVYDWAASTGREQYEISPRGVRTKTDTPAGFYELDPERMYRAYHSNAWDQSMPYAMFFNWQTHGDQTGLAIHAAVAGDINKLGSPASAGCVHISPGHAQLLYEMIRADYKGRVPRFAYDPATQSTSNHGAFMRDTTGNLVMGDGYRVLIDIENFSGGDSFAAID